MIFLTTAAVTFFGLLIGLPILIGILKYLCWFITVNECRCKVFVLFGKVIGVIDEPGLHITPFSIGPRVLLVPFFGKVHTLDMRLDQRYLRSRPVNSEEGTPVGLGVWYEMRVSDPVSYLFENTDSVHHAFLCDFIVTPDERRKGYASAALSEMERDATAHGCTESRLYVCGSNHSALNLYTRCGYSIFRQVDGGVYMKKELK